MLEQLINLVKEQADDIIVNNPAMPNQHNDSVIGEVANQLFSGLQNHASSGNLQNIISLFQNGVGNGGVGNNPMVAGIIASAAEGLASKFGVSHQVANSISSTLLPTVMNQFISKTNDPNDTSFDLGNILKSASGNHGLDIGSILGQATDNRNNPAGSLTDIAGKLFGN
jgi:hypothetical protein